MSRNLWKLCVPLLGIVYLAGSEASGQSVAVSYEGNTLPADDPVAAWEASISECAYQVVAGGFLGLTDASGQTGYISFSRLEPTLPSVPIIIIEGRVRALGNNGIGSSPALVLADYDPGLPPTNPSHIVYALHLFPDHIEFYRRRISEGADDLIATISVPDLVQNFHVVRLVRLESTTRRVEFYLDGLFVAAADGDPLTWPLTHIGFGHGFFTGAGMSQWDYVRYWSDGPVPTRVATWGALKATYR